MGRFGTLRPNGTLLWCRRPFGVSDAPPYAPALAAWFDPARLLMVTVRRDEDLFWAMEEGLRCPGMAAVLRASKDLANSGSSPKFILYPDPALRTGLIEAAEALVEKYSPGTILATPKKLAALGVTP